MAIGNPGVCLSSVAAGGGGGGGAVQASRRYHHRHRHGLYRRRGVAEYVYDSVVVEAEGIGLYLTEVENSADEDEKLGVEDWS